MNNDPIPSAHLTGPAAERIYSLVIVEELDQELLDAAFPAGPPALSA